MIEFVDERPPVTREALADAERELTAFGQHIPASYRAFLTQRDGGRPVRDRFIYEKDNETYRGTVQVLLGVGEVESPRANLTKVADVFQERVPAGVLPIGRDPGGNLICIDGRDGADGPVFLWDHDFENFDGPADDANLYFIAPDLDTFFARLHENRDPPPEVQVQSRGLKRLFGRR